MRQNKAVFVILDDFLNIFLTQLIDLTHTRIYVQQTSTRTSKILSNKHLI